jgi:hypothetical protein
MTGRIRDLTRNMDGSYNLTVTVKDDCRSMVDQLKDTSIDVEIKKHRNKRSLDANAYAWVLIGKLAEALRMDKADIYKQAIREIGGTSTIVCVPDKALEALQNGWKTKGIGWQTETMPSKLDGCTNVVLYYGSSTYDTKQMSLLIDHLVQDAKEQGIETLPPAELERMIGKHHAA